MLQRLPELVGDMSFSNENTAAHHLYMILQGVRDSGEDNHVAGWCSVLGVDWGNIEFARRHSEVVALLQMTIRQLDALPERSRLRCERYVGAWWTAVMQPIINWSDTARPAHGIIDEDKLDHLESTAELISGNLVGSGAAPRSADLDEMTRQCHEWINLLTSMGEGEIFGPVRDELISQIRHLIWLIENVGLFGGARVSGEASTVIGSLAQAGATLVNAQPNNASRWKTALLALIAACVVFNQASPIIQESIASGEGLIKEISTVVDNLQEDEK
ncbi:hypothetical protein [Streptomyces sp. 2-1]|uniref:hypothetical protein n=1 Tax=Streptomyces sp. 2-1 TaxID=412710 RepID=UPI003AFA151C